VLDSLTYTCVARDLIMRLGRAVSEGRIRKCVPARSEKYRAQNTGSPAWLGVLKFIVNVRLMRQNMLIDPFAMSPYEQSHFQKKATLSRIYDTVCFYPYILSLLLFLNYKANYVLPDDQYFTPANKLAKQRTL
jgi:hypothetical protein